MCNDKIIRKKLNLKRRKKTLSHSINLGNRIATQKTSETVEAKIGWGTKNQTAALTPAANLGCPRCLHLVVFPVGLLCEEARLLQLVLEGLHPLLVRERPVLQDLPHAATERRASGTGSEFGRRSGVSINSGVGGCPWCYRSLHRMLGLFLNDPDLVAPPLL